MKILRMLSACWMTKTADTHSKCIKRIVFSREQWLRERALILRLYEHCLSCFNFKPGDTYNNHLPSKGWNKIDLSTQCVFSSRVSPFTRCSATDLLPVALSTGRSVWDAVCHHHHHHHHPPSKKNAPSSALKPSPGLLQQPYVLSARSKASVQKLRCWRRMSPERRHFYIFTINSLFIYECNYTSIHKLCPSFVKYSVY
jgi:hypothetical protein